MAPPTQDAPNPFRAIGLPPAGAGPEAQVRYLEQLVQAFESSEHPRLKPLRKRLNASLKGLAKGAEQGVDPIILAKRFAGEVVELQVATYELLAAVVTEVRVKLKETGKAAAADLDAGLDALATSLRRVVAALKRRDREALEKLAPLLDSANDKLERAGAVLNALAASAVGPKT